MQKRPLCVPSTHFRFVLHDEHHNYIKPVHCINLSFHEIIMEHISKNVKTGFRLVFGV